MQQEKRLNYDQVQEIIAPKIESFVKDTLNGRYKEFVSDVFLNAYLSREFEIEYRQMPWSIAKNIAYKAAVGLFEGILEHGCGAHGNGHHVAQSFARQFNDEPL